MTKHGLLAGVLVTIGVLHPLPGTAQEEALLEQLQWRPPIFETGDQAPIGCLDALAANVDPVSDCEARSTAFGLTTFFSVRNASELVSSSVQCHLVELETQIGTKRGGVVFLEGTGRFCRSLNRTGNFLEVSFVCSFQTRDGAAQPCLATELQGALQPVDTGAAVRPRYGDVVTIQGSHF